MPCPRFVIKGYQMKKMLIFVLIGFASVVCFAAGTAEPPSSAAPASSPQEIDGGVRANFQPGGAVLDFDFTYYSPLDDTSDYYDLYYSMSLNTFVSEGISLGVRLNYDYDYYYDEGLFDIRIPVSYIFPLMPPGATTGSAMGFTFDVGFLGLGSDTRESSFYIWPILKSYFFLNPRVALYFNLEFMRINLSSWATETVDTYMNIGTGLSFFFPHKDYALVKKAGAAPAVAAASPVQESTVSAGAAAAPPAPASPSSSNTGTDANPVVLANGDRFVGTVSGGLPQGQGVLIAGPYKTIGYFIDGKPEGLCTIIDPEGREVKGMFRDGKAEGAFTVQTASGSSQAFFSNGVRMDLDVNRMTRDLLREVEQLKQEAQRILSSGKPLEATEDLLFRISEKRQKIEENHRAEEVMARFSYGEKEYELRLEDGELLRLSTSEEDIVYDADGNAVSVTTVTKSGLLGEKGLGFEIKQETLTRNYEPVKKVAFKIANVGANLAFSDVYSMVGGSAGVSYRSFSNGGRDFPGPEGGQGKGLDLRAGANLQIMAMTMETYDYSGGGWYPETVTETNVFGYAMGQATVGYTWFKFKPMDQATLQQKGSGWTLGIGGAYNMAFSSDDSSGYGGFLPLPLVSWEFYNYNPNTAKYSVKSLTGFIWPVPFSLSVNYAFSF